MAKARIDRMENGRYRVGDKSFAFTSKTNGVYINSSGGTSQGSTEGQHVVEYAIYTPGKTYTFTYWRPSSSSQLCIAYINSGGTLIGGVYGGSSGAVTAQHTVPSGTAKVRVYGIYRSGSTTYTANASMKPVVAEGVCAVSEIRIKPSGASESQVVWPAISVFKIVPGTVTVRYSDNGSAIFASGYNFAYATADIQEIRGETVIRILPAQILTPVGFDYNPQDEIAGNLLPRWRIVNVTLSGTTIQGVKGNDLKTVSVPGGYGVTTTFRYADDVVTALVSQQANIISSTTIINRTLKGFGVTPDVESLSSSGGNVVVTGKATYEQTPRYQWTSGSYSNGPVETASETQAPSSISVNPSSGVTIGSIGATTTITFPPNGQNDEIDYTITGTYYGSSGTAHVGVKGSDTGRVYSDLSIQSYSYGIIPASGGSVYPTISVRIYVSVNGGNNILMSGQISSGEASCVVSGGGYTTTVPITYINAPNGLVSAASRGTEQDQSNTVVASGLNIRASKANMTATWNTTLSVYQQQNQVTFRRQGTFHVTSFSVTPKANNAILPKTSGIYQLNTAASTIVGLDVRASGNGTTTYQEYTSGAHSGGNTITLDNEDVDPSTISVTSGGSPVSVTNKQFAADNHHNLSAKTYLVYAAYEDASESFSITQIKDEKISDGTPTYYATLSMKPNTSNTIGAPGGEAFIIATAYHITGTKWKSDNAPVPGESTQTWDTSRISLAASQSAAGAYTVTPYDTQSDSITFRVSHRDMKNNVTIDTLSVYAMNGDPSSPSTYADSSASPVTFSATNAVDTSQTYEEAGAIVWGAEYTENDNYNISFMIAAYTSDTAPAPFVGGSTTYSVQAYHRVAYYHDGTQTTKYWQHYTSWTEEHDDAEHRYLYNTVVTPYTHVFVTAETDWNDTASVAKRYSDVGWVTVNQSNQTITFSAQTVDGSPQRSTSIIATNTSDPASEKVSVSKTVYQQAKQSLAASPNRHNFEWDDTQRAIFDITSWYVQFKVAVTGDWISAEISFQNGLDGTWGAVNPDTKYGIVTGARYPKLRVTALSANYGSTMRLAQIDLIPQDTTGLSAVYLQITQDPYGGGPSNND